MDLDDAIMELKDIPKEKSVVVNRYLSSEVPKYTLLNDTNGLGICYFQSVSLLWETHPGKLVI